MQEKQYRLAVGNKNLSSWSLRAWLMMKATGAPFTEVTLALDTPSSKQDILRLSPSGLVPVLLTEGQAIWDSLAIGEYLAETFPKARLWPQDKYMRAHARSISAEMHSGFAALRSQCSMDMHKRASMQPGADVAAEVARIEQLWADARAMAKQGDLLYGHFTIADAMYAPVVSRFVTHGITVGKESRRYMNAIWALPAFAEWYAGAEREVKAA